jgi:hypothetical protein
MNEQEIDVRGHSPEERAAFWVWVETFMLENGRKPTQCEQVRRYYARGLHLTSGARS